MPSTEDVRYSPLRPKHQPFPARETRRNSVTNALKNALEQFCSLKRPSIGKLLRTRGFRHEARIVENLIDAYEAEKDMAPPVQPINSNSTFWGI